MELLQKIISALPPVLLISGTLLNLLCLMVCLKKRLRGTTTFIFIAFNSVFNTIPLYFLNLNGFTLTYFGSTLQQTIPFYCRTATFFHYFSFHTSAWLLVSMNVEICLSVKFLKWRKEYVDAKKTIIFCFVVVAVFLATNVTTIFKSSFIGSIQNTTTAFCQCAFDQDFFLIWSDVSLYIYSIIPFSIILVSNSILIHDLVFKKSHIRMNLSLKEKAKRAKMSKLIITLTFSFIVLTTPNCVMLSKMHYKMITPNIILGLETTTALNFLFNAFNLVIVCVSNNQFRKELKSLLSEFYIIKRTRVGIATS